MRLSAENHDLLSIFIKILLEILRRESKEKLWEDFPPSKAGEGSQGFSPAIRIPEVAKQLKEEST